VKRNSIAVMNTKGGVGKSTLVLALAETLSAFHGKNVLVIDSDAQASVSSMLMGIGDLHKLQSSGLTIVELLIAAVLNDTPIDWPKYVVRNVSDVDDARSVFVIPSDMQLTLFEREVSKESLHARLRASINTLLAQTRPVFDVILIDCPPGLSVLTESWLREADFHLSPTKPDYVSVCGLEVFRRFKALNPEMGFADNLGVLVNMIDPGSANDQQYLTWLRANPENRCFETFVARANSLQDAARFQLPDRSFSAKYPGISQRSLRAVAEELLARLTAANQGVIATAPASAPATPADAIVNPIVRQSAPG
jgi:chromosome partitioning protein